MYWRTSDLQTFFESNISDIWKSTLSSSLLLLVFATSTQFAVDGESNLFFNSNCLKAYLNWSTVGLLFQPKRLLILEKYISIWSWEKRYVKIYSNGVSLLSSYALLISMIERADMVNPRRKNVFLRPLMIGIPAVCFKYFRVSIPSIKYPSIS